MNTKPYRVVFDTPYLVTPPSTDSRNNSVMYCSFAGGQMQSQLKGLVA
jgi:hypothetical protein